MTGKWWHDKKWWKQWLALKLLHRLTAFPLCWWIEDNYDDDEDNDDDDDDYDNGDDDDNYNDDDDDNDDDDNYDNADIVSCCRFWWHSKMMSIMKIMIMIILVGMAITVWEGRWLDDDADDQNKDMIMLMIMMIMMKSRWRIWWHSNSQGCRTI